MDDQEFPVLGTQKTARKVTGPADPDDTERDRRPSGHPIPVSPVVLVPGFGPGNATSEEHSVGSEREP